MYETSAQGFIFFASRENNALTIINQKLSIQTKNNKMKVLLQLFIPMFCSNEEDLTPST